MDTEVVTKTDHVSEPCNGRCDHPDDCCHQPLPNVGFEVARRVLNAEAAPRYTARPLGEGWCVCDSIDRSVVVQGNERWARFAADAMNEKCGRFLRDPKDGCARHPRHDVDRIFDLINAVNDARIMWDSASRVAEKRHGESVEARVNGSTEARALSRVQYELASEESQKRCRAYNAAVESLLAAYLLPYQNINPVRSANRPVPESVRLHRESVIDATIEKVLPLVRTGPGGDFTKDYTPGQRFDTTA